MDDRERENRVDELLDAALARYSRVEPRPDALERAVAAARRPRALAWGRWLWLPVGAAVVVLVLVLASPDERVVQPAQSPPSVAQAPPAESPATAPAVKEAGAPEPIGQQPLVAERTEPGAAPAIRPAPRLERFPSPAPLSEQERLLLRYVQQTPPEQLVALRLGEGKLEPLRIEPLRIPPSNSGPN